MKKLAFISRHVPTLEQAVLAAKYDFVLVHIGDMDAFTISVQDVRNACPDAGAVAVVHSAAALRLVSDFPVCIFENENRAPEGERPQFKTVRMYLYRVSGNKMESDHVEL